MRPATGATGGATASPGSASPPAFQASIASSRAFGLAAREGPLFPSDFEIGPLEDERGVNPERKATVAVIRKFLEALIEGRVETSLASPGRETLLEALSAPFLSEPKVVYFRIGRIVIEEDAALARIRLEANLSGVGGSRRPRAIGEIRLHRIEGSWRVDELAVDSTGLSVPPPASADPWEPASLP